MKNIFLIISVLIIIVGLATFNRSEINKANIVKVKKKLEDCSVQENECNVDLNGLKIKIKLDNNILYLKPFKIYVWNKSNQQENIESINISFKMKNMNMGETHFILKKNVVNNEQQWSTTGLLPICVTGRVDWLLFLEIKTKDNHYLLSFPITVKKASQ